MGLHIFRTEIEAETYSEAISEFMEYVKSVYPASERIAESQIESVKIGRKETNIYWVEASYNKVE